MAVRDVTTGAFADLQAAVLAGCYGDFHVGSFWNDILGDLPELAAGGAGVWPAGRAWEAVAVDVAYLVGRAGVELAGGGDLLRKRVVRMIRGCHEVLEFDARGAWVLRGEFRAEGCCCVLSGSLRPVHAFVEDLQADVPADLVGVGVPGAGFDLKGASDGFPGVGGASGDVPD